MAGNEYFALVQRFESPLWVSMVCRGLDRWCFRAALGWDFGVRRYRYVDHRHQISVDDAVAISDLAGRAATPDDFERVRSRCVAACTELERLALDLSTLRPTEMSAAATFDAWHAVAHASLTAMPFLPTIVVLQDILEHRLRSAIADSRGVDEDAPEIVDAVRQLLVPRSPAGFVPETRSVLKMGRDYSREGLADVSYDELPAHWRRRVAAHCETFGWLGTFAYLNEPFDVHQVLERVRRASTAGDTGLEATLARERHDAVAAERAISALESETARHYAELARDFLLLRFDRVDVHWKADAWARPLVARLAGLMGLTRDEFVCLTYDEVLAWSKSGSLPHAEELRRRHTSSIVYEVEDGRHSWRAAEPVVRQVDRVKRQVALDEGISGTTACAGRAVGAVRHVTSPADMVSFAEGDVLVTPMTTPDVMLAIERAAAIVTDEGGLLCHAAIISRELDKPCVIGTGLASVALIDGDIIDVTAAESGLITLVDPVP